MLRFLIRRTALGAIVLWLISMLVFTLFFVAPSNVARTLAGRQATPETVALIQHRLGLGQVELAVVEGALAVFAGPRHARAEFAATRDELLQ